MCVGGGGAAQATILDPPHTHTHTHTPPPPPPPPPTHLTLPVQRKIGDGRYHKYSNDRSVGKSIKSDKLYFGMESASFFGIGASI